MSNRSIANDLIAVLDDFRAARVTATDVEDAVERAVQAMEAMENVSLRDIDRSRDLTHELVEAALNDESEDASLGPELTDVLESPRNHVAVLGKRHAT